MARFATLLLTLAAGASADAQVSEKVHRAVYERARESVVAVRALAPLGERSGTGIVLSADGLLLTSYAVCPEGSTKIRVWTPGPRRADAEIVAASPRDEITLLRIKPERPLRPAELGHSADVRVGQPAYTLGNAANSIILDDQPSFQTGLVSAAYRLDQARAGARWTGWVLETTAAVNVGMDGAPCLDAAGRVIGVVTQNYSPHRFLGAVIPVDELRPVIERLRTETRGTAADSAAAPAGEGTLGATFKDEGGRVVIASVDKEGPADLAGLVPGDVVVAVGGRPVKSAREAAERLGGLEAGSLVRLSVELGGRAEELRIPLEARKK
ncbi:MAG TPA: S1C family serine protease [Planctomycetota bacterium]|nr:S1C family serine protease [Planctomycetota bacterium]